MSNDEIAPHVISVVPGISGVKLSKFPDCYTLYINYSDGARYGFDLYYLTSRADLANELHKLADFIANPPASTT